MGVGGACRDRRGERRGGFWVGERLLEAAMARFLEGLPGGRALGAKRLSYHQPLRVLLMHHQAVWCSPVWGAPHAPDRSLL